MICSQRDGMFSDEYRAEFARRSVLDMGVRAAGNVVRCAGARVNGVLCDTQARFRLPFDFDISDLGRFVVKRVIAFALLTSIMADTRDQVPIAVAVKETAAGRHEIFGRDRHEKPHSETMMAHTLTVGRVEIAGLGSHCDETLASKLDRRECQATRALLRPMKLFPQNHRSIPQLLPVWFLS